MTTATWWWAKDKAPAEPSVPPTNPPIIQNPGYQTYYDGQVIDLRIDNTGGPAGFWTADRLPAGLSITEQTNTYCRITGVAQAIAPPVVVNPGNVEYYESQTDPVQIDNTGGPVKNWHVNTIPDRWKLTTQTPEYCLIENVDYLPLAPLDTTFFEAYLEAQHGPHGDYEGHGPRAITNGDCVEAAVNGGATNDEALAACGVDLGRSVHFYDYGRSAMAAYYFLQAKGYPPDPRWVTYADGDVRFWDAYFRGANTPYRVTGTRTFSGGFSVMYDYDPVTYAWCAESIRQLVLNGIYCEYGVIDLPRDYYSREMSYGQLNYLDYLYDKPSDPLWLNNYPRRRDELFGYCYQWLDECKEYGYIDPMDYNASGDDRDPVGGEVNVLNFSNFMGHIAIEALLRIYYTDPDVDQKQILSWIRRYAKIIFDESWMDDRTNCYWKWYDCTVDTGGCLYRPGPATCGLFGDYWCEKTNSAVWAGAWQLHSLGMIYRLTGDREWIDRGDEIWEQWFGTNRFIDIASDEDTQKENSHMLRYCLEYLMWRGDYDYNSYFKVTTGIGQAPPVPTKLVFPVVSAPTTATAVVGEVFSLQLTSDPAAPEWKGLNLPPGLTVDNTGLISGTPLAQNASVLSTFFAIGTDGYSDEAVIDFNVLPATGTPVVDPVADQYDEVNQAITPLQLTASNSPTSWAVVDPLPTGLSLNTTNGQITGTPTVQDFTTSSVTATNAVGTSAPVTIDWTIHGAATDAPIVQDPGAQNLTLNTPATVYVRNVGGPVTTWTWNTDSWLPTGMSVTDSTQPYYLEISGTPTELWP